METNLFTNSQQTMTSLEIAEVTGKQHSHVMEAIRKMESSWLKMGQSNFRLASYNDAQGKVRPCYELTRRECLYIATKFNDEARAKLILRWESLETGKAQPLAQQPMSPLEMFELQVKINREHHDRLASIEQRLDNMEQEREENGRLLLETKVSTNAVPAMSLRKSIIALVNEYSAATNTDQKDVWHAVYKNLYYRYGKSINSYKKLLKKESKLDIAEREGFLESIFDIISDMIVKWRDSNN